MTKQYICHLIKEQIPWGQSHYLPAQCSSSRAQHRTWHGRWPGNCCLINPLLLRDSCLLPVYRMAPGTPCTLQPVPSNFLRTQNKAIPSVIPAYKIYWNTTTHSAFTEAVFFLAILLLPQFTRIWCLKVFSIQYLNISASLSVCHFPLHPIANHNHPRFHSFFSKAPPTI